MLEYSTINIILWVVFGILFIVYLLKKESKQKVSWKAVKKKIFKVLAKDRSKEIKAGVEKAKVHGGGRPRLKLDLEAAIALRKQNHSIQEISSMLKIPRQTLSRRLKEAEENQKDISKESRKAQKKNFSRLQIKEIKDLIIEGWSIKHIAEKYNVTLSKIYSLLKKKKILSYKQLKLEIGHLYAHHSIAEISQHLRISVEDTNKIIERERMKKLQFLVVEKDVSIPQKHPQTVKRRVIQNILKNEKLWRGIIEMSRNGKNLSEISEHFKTSIPICEAVLKCGERNHIYIPWDKVDKLKESGLSFASISKKLNLKRGLLERRYPFKNMEISFSINNVEESANKKKYWRNIADELDNGKSIGTLSRKYQRDEKTLMWNLAKEFNYDFESNCRVAIPWGRVETLKKSGLSQKKIAKELGISFKTFVFRSHLHKYAKKAQLVKEQ